MRELSLHILDIMENCADAGAKKVYLCIEEDKSEGKLKIVIEDDGRGMSQEELNRALDPFYTTRSTRRVGLGLPLFYETTKRCDGDFRLDSHPGKGTRVEASFTLDHIDLPPMGDLAGTITAFMAGHPEVDLTYVHRTNGDEFVLDTEEVKGILGVDELTDPAIIEFLRGKIREAVGDLS